MKIFDVEKRIGNGFRTLGVNVSLLSAYVFPDIKYISSKEISYLF